MKVLLDLFPARARLSPAEHAPSPEEQLAATVLSRLPQSRYVDAVRVVISDERVMIAADTSRGPALIFNERYDGATLSLNKKGTSRLVTETGKFVTFDKDANCGCGSRLRGWNPYTTLHSANDPTE